jgi:hypothetical protein
MAAFARLTPVGHLASGEIQWLFSLPQEREQFVSAARGVAKTLRERFSIQAAPT